MKHFKKTVGIISAAVLALALVPVTALVANADTPVNYYGKSADGSVDSGTVTDYSLITSADTQWGTDGTTTWYVADSDLTIDEKVEVMGNVNIIVKDGVNFIINGGIEGSTAQVTVYSETEAGTGIIAVTGADGYTGADGLCWSGADNVNGGTGEDGLVAVDCGKFIVSGGIVTVVGGKGGNGGEAGDNYDYETGSYAYGVGGSGGNGADAFTNTTEIYLYGGTLNVRGGKGGSPANDYNSTTSSGTPGESGRALHGIYAVNGTLNALSNSENGTDDKADYFLLPVEIPEGSELTLKGDGIAKVDNGTEITSYGDLTLDTVLDVKDGGAIYTNGNITASIADAVVKNNTGIVRRITPNPGEGWSVDQTNKCLNVEANYKMVSSDGTNSYTSTVSGSAVVLENNLLGVILIGDGAYIDDSASCPNELPYYIDVDCGSYAELLSGNCFVDDSESETYTFNNLAMGTMRFADNALITDSNGTAISADKYTYDSSNGTIGLISVTENIKIVANLESCDFDIAVTDNEGTAVSSVSFNDDYDTGSSIQTKTLKIKVTGDGTVTNCRVVKESDFDKNTGTVGTDTSVFTISYIVNPNNADGFEVTDRCIEKILSGESGSFIIAPKDNLAAGTYEETFLVYSDNSDFANDKYVARFTVKYNVVHDSDGEYYYDDNTEHYSKCVNCFAHVDIEAHTFNIETVNNDTFAKAADCTNPAKYYYSCVCGAHSDKMTETFEDGEPNGHSYGAWTESTAATCTEGGQEKRICSVCKNVEYRDTNPLGHDWDEDYTVDLQPTCTEKGSKSIHCSKCSATKDVTEIDANGHSYGAWTESTAATCTEGGQEKRICSVCKNVEYRDTNPLGHDWDEDYTVDLQPTCTEKGSKSIHCSKCSATKDVTEIDANGHSFGEWTLYSTAGCSDKGQEKRSCSVCGYEEYRDTDFDPDNHTWEDHYTVDKEPTCTTEGSESIHCSKCGATKDSRVIPVIDHIRGEWEIDTEPTCTTEGSESIHCTMCGLLLDTRAIPTTEHEMGEWETVLDPTCTEDGKEKRICKECGAEEYRTIDHDHLWEDDYTIDKEPDCENDGSKSIHCSVCDTVKDEEVIPAIGHDWGEWKLVKEPTKTENGEEQRTCNTCKKTESRSIKYKGFWTHDDKGHWHEDEDGNRYYYSDHEFTWVEDESGRGHYQCISCAFIKYEDDKSNPDTSVPSVAVFVATALIAGGAIPVVRRVKTKKNRK